MKAFPQRAGLARFVAELAPNLLSSPRAELPPEDGGALVPRLTAQRSVYHLEWQTAAAPKQRRRPQARFGWLRLLPAVARESAVFDIVVYGAFGGLQMRPRMPDAQGHSTNDLSCPCCLQHLVSANAVTYTASNGISFITKSHARSTTAAHCKRYRYGDIISALASPGSPALPYQQFVRKGKHVFQASGNACLS